jgi:hypothetical protein
MSGIKACSKCGSKKIIPNVSVIDYRNQMTPGELTVVVQEDPDAMIFKGTRTGRLRAWVCGECGYVDMFVGNPDELYSAYQKSKNIQPS